MRDFDLILYGATGYTGRLVAEYLTAAYAGTDAPRWALAGRSPDKLAQLRDELGAPASTPLVTASSDAPESIRALAQRASVVITTVGPYSLHGATLVEACATAGTAYVDLCGEPTWMRQMIDAHAERARTSGARIVFSCGFDSIPFDLGVLTLQEAARARFGRPCPRVMGRVRALKGGTSGGTLASLRAVQEAAARDPFLASLLDDPFALAPGFRGPAQPPGNAAEHDELLGVWLAPFIMAPINTKNVHRTNHLLGHAYGSDFVYDEMMVTGPGEKGKAIAEAIRRRDMLAGGPQPGEGPTREERESGSYDILFTGLMPDGARVEVVVTGDRDPGYGSTSKMIVESAVCLLRDVRGEGGIWTPGALMGAALRKRLEAHAGLTFTVR